MSIRRATTALATCLLLPLGLSGQQADVFDRVQHGSAVSEGGVKIHYATLGAGPLVVMIHGFPDFWHTWRHQMAALSDTCQVVAIDQCGYNLSDKPKGVESYEMRLLVTDVAAVIRHLGRDKATIVGHDWGGMVAWQFAMNLPAMRLEKDLTLVTVPGAAHFVQRDAAELVASTMKWWLTMRTR